MTLELETIKWIPWLPALAAVVGGVCCMRKSMRNLAAPACILSILAGFIITLGVQSKVTVDSPRVFKAFTWIHIENFAVDFSFYVDPLTIIMLTVITGVGTLVAWYASGYMKGDRGYARFFAAVSLFIFAMTILVMADNLFLLYLGWEGVGLCSYLLIGFYYNKPAAVAAAKKAFIVNRIGDLFFALGIFLTYSHFHTVSLAEVLRSAGDLNTNLHAGGQGVFDLGAAPSVVVIPFLLMLGAFGKSAQLPLYMWLPDAMEGPTPVSALIHAATMVTAGVYLIARLLPLFALSPYALPIVAAVGGATALFAATIALCQCDIKRIFAYSTISQLGYMFMGVGAVSTAGPTVSATGAIYHLFTHAFFKALLFLTAGSVMHSLAGQLDLRKMSGLSKKMPITSVLMLIGCLALAGFPFTSGFFSKDLILADVVEMGRSNSPFATLYSVLGIVGVATAFLTAFYTFRLWFRVFTGPEQYEMGSDGHGHEEEGHDAGKAGHEQAHAPKSGETASAAIAVEHHHEPHEVSFVLMNLPLIFLAIGALGAGLWESKFGWIHHGIETSSAFLGYIPKTASDAGEAHDIHFTMQLISGSIAIVGIALAAWFHWLNRPAGERVARAFSGLVKVLNNKYYVDELNDALIVRPLRTLADVLFVFDSLIIDGIVQLVGFLPRALGMSLRPSQQGELQGYGLGMAFGAAFVLIVVLWSLNLVAMH
ncbi:MAG: NADH-quinone oxidoreductase subunit L [Planctomycetota bacterium]|nr:NADH-quinone oxidoreductase subunit L [Planctomycetota bacterium]